MRLILVLLGLLGAATMLLACGGGSANEASQERGARAQPVLRYAYTVSIDEGLRELDITVCFEGSHAASLHCPQAMATMALRRAEIRIDGELPTPLETAGRELPIPSDLPADACVGYVVSIDDAMGASWMNGTRVGDAVLLNASGWLWAPQPLADDAEGTLELALPEGIDAALAYPRDGERYALRPSAFRYLSHTVFGRFDRFDVDVPGGQLEVARLPGELAVSDEEIVAWLERAGEISAQLHGRFPVPRALVAVVPVGGGDGVAFGNVGRGGGSSVMLLASREATLDGLVGDWVPPHEFTHLSMPFVRRSDAWMSEGVATYYQEVLRARAGVQTPLEAWRNIDRGFASGREDGTGRSLEVESAQMFRTASFRRVYWSGTALALMADVELRKAGRSLDDAIAALPDCCMVPERSWPGREMAGAFDRATGTTAYTDVVDRWLPSHDFPDVDSTFAWLGLTRDAEGLLELTDGPGSGVRDAIMGGNGNGNVERERERERGTGTRKGKGTGRTRRFSSTRSGVSGGP